MRDLKHAIRCAIKTSSPLYLDKKLKGYLIPSNILNVLIAEYNIHFVEPENEQLTRNDSPISIEITGDNLRIRP